MSDKYPDMPDKFYEALGWMHAECCAALDRGEDPRKMDLSEMAARCVRDFQKEQANDRTQWSTSKHGTGPLQGDY